MSEFWAILEHNGTTLHEQSSELVSEVVEIAQHYQKYQQTQPHICAVLLMAPQDDTPTYQNILNTGSLSGNGVHALYILEHPQLAQYATEDYVSALAWLIQRHHPMLVMTSATPNGRDWMPRLATRLHLPFISACLGLELRDDALIALRSLYEGRAYAQTRTVLHGRSALATLIPGTRGALTKTQVTLNNTSSTATVEVIRFTPEIEQTPGQKRIRHRAVQAPSPEEVELDAAERIIAGGRGIGQEGFTTLATFAHALGAAVGATRVATDLGWIEHTRQIGATGKIVRPKLYIACGISGAAQHTSGMSESQTVIAINPDRNAPIFALADLGLLGDANQILPLAAKSLGEKPS